MIQRTETLARLATVALTTLAVGCTRKAPVGEPANQNVEPKQTERRVATQTPRASTQETTVEAKRATESLKRISAPAPRTPRARTTFSTLPSGTQVKRQFDAKGRLVSVEAQGAKAKETFQYRGSKLVAHTTPDERTTRFEYDGAGRLEASQDASGKTTFQFDGRDRASRVTTPAGRRWSFRWSKRGLAVQDGPMGKVEFTRDKRGRLTKTRDASGREVYVNESQTERAVEVSSAEGETTRVEFDRRGRVLAAKAGQAKLGYFYDLKGRLKEIRTQGQVLLYKHRDRVESVQTPYGVFTRTHDAAGRLTRLETPAGTFRFEYTLRGRRAKVTYPNGVVTVLTHDGLGRVTKQTTRKGRASVLELASGFNARQERTFTNRDGQVARYAYDAVGRLSRIERGADVISYRYDADGNRIAINNRAARFDARGRILSEGGVPFRHDAAGRLVAQGKDTFGYDSFGRLIEVARAGQAKVRYGYDPVGRIATRTVDGKTTRYLYEGTRLLAEVGARTRVYVYGPQIDEPLAYRENGRWTFLHADALGNVLAYTDVNGKRIARAEFAPFGELRQAPGKGQPVFFAGRSYDTVAQVVPMRARVYAPALGRFLTPDPSGLMGGINAYAYVGNDPLDYVDPFGLKRVLASEREAKNANDLQRGLGASFNGLINEPDPSARSNTNRFIARGRDGLGDLGASNAPGGNRNRTFAEREGSYEAVSDQAKLLGSASKLKTFHDHLEAILERDQDTWTRRDALTLSKDINDLVGDHFPEFKQATKNPLETWEKVENAIDFAKDLRYIVAPTEEELNDPVYELKAFKKYLGQLGKLADKVPGMGEFYGKYVEALDGIIENAEIIAEATDKKNQAIRDVFKNTDDYIKEDEAKKLKERLRREAEEFLNNRDSLLERGEEDAVDPRAEADDQNVRDKTRPFEEIVDSERRFAQDDVKDLNEIREKLRKLETRVKGEESWAQDYRNRSFAEQKPHFARNLRKQYDELKAKEAKEARSLELNERRYRRALERYLEEKLLWDSYRNGARNPISREEARRRARRYVRNTRLNRLQRDLWMAPPVKDSVDHDELDRILPPAPQQTDRDRSGRARNKSKTKPGKTKRPRKPGKTKPGKTKRGKTKRGKRGNYRGARGALAGERRRGSR